MSLTTTTHLNFRGDARAALEFYQSVFGGALAVTTYGDFGVPAGVHGADKVVFGQLLSAEGFRVLAYDIPGETGGSAGAGGSASAGGSAGAGGSTRRENNVTLTDQPFFVAVDGDTFDEVQGYWNALAADATVVEPLAASAWSAGFGMLTDRFGVTWILGVAAPAPVTPTPAAPAE